MKETEVWRPVPRVILRCPALSARLFSWQLPFSWFCADDVGCSHGNTMSTCFPYRPRSCFNPSPGNGFCDICRQGGIKYHQAYLEFYSRWRQNSNGYTYVFGVTLSNAGTSDFVGRRCALEIHDGSQITGSTNSVTLLILQIHIVLKTIHGFMIMCETSKFPAIMADATSCRKSKMAAN